MMGTTELKNSQKESIAQAVVMGLLLTNGFVVAKPQPDLGDDLWIQHPSNPNRVLRAQFKSLWNQVQRKGKRRYSANIQANVLSKQNGNSCLLVALRDGSIREGFRVGCFPCAYFRQYDGKMRRVTFNDKRIRINLYFELMDDSKIVLEINKGEKPDVTKYFVFDNVVALLSGKIAK